MSEAAKEAVWIRKFTAGLGVIKNTCSPVNLYCDNTGAIAQAKEPRAHARSKHVQRRFHVIRELIEFGEVKICKIATEDNIADPLTKALTQPKHEGHVRSMGLRWDLDWN